MAIRYGRTNELGLVVAPPQLDCLGTECPVAARQGRCFIDEHHLYFPRAKFLPDPLYEKFWRSPFNRIRLPRCQHNSSYLGAQHSMIDDVLRPPAEVITAFLDEAQLLGQLGMVRATLRQLEVALSTDNPRFAARNPASYLERYDEYTGQAEQLARQAKKLEVIPLRQRQAPHVVGALSLQKAA